MLIRDSQRHFIQGNVIEYVEEVTKIPHGSLNHRIKTHGSMGTW